MLSLSGNIVAKMISRSTKEYFRTQISTQQTAVFSISTQLSDVESGGATVFIKQNLRVMPQKVSTHV